MRICVPESNFLRAVTIAASLGIAGSFSTANAASIFVENHSFEETGGMTPFGEFFFGVNPGWELVNPGLVNAAGSGIFTGTLEPDTSPGVWFNGGAPDGDLVAILFGFGTGNAAHAGAYGLEQELTGTVLEAGMHYELQVEVGNIGEGNALNGDFFPLDTFPGYQVQLWAGNTLLAEDDDSLVIPEREFMTSTVSYTAVAGDPGIGETLSIRLINLNLDTGATYTDPATGQTRDVDIEVDFDNVRLTATRTVPEPETLGLLACALGAVALRKRRRNV